MPFVRTSETAITSGPLAGSTLIRMRRPADWPTEWCQLRRRK